MKSSAQKRIYCGSQGHIVISGKQAEAALSATLEARNQALYYGDLNGDSDDQIWERFFAEAKFIEQKYGVKICRVFTDRRPD